MDYDNTAPDVALGADYSISKDLFSPFFSMLSIFSLSMIFLLPLAHLQLLLDTRSIYDDSVLYAEESLFNILYNPDTHVYRALHILGQYGHCGFDYA